jgi:hypothetical protein
MDDGYDFDKVFDSKVLSHRELRLRVKFVGRDDDAPGGPLAGQKRRREEDKGACSAARPPSRLRRSLVGTNHCIPTL